MRQEITFQERRHRLTCSKRFTPAAGLKQTEKGEGGSRETSGRLLEYSRPEVKVAQTRVETAEVERRDEFQVSLEGPAGRACVGWEGPRLRPAVLA